MLISKYHRIIVVEGKDSIDFLQGQISTDVSKQEIEQIDRSAICNLKGRVIASFLCKKISNDLFHLVTHQSVVKKLVDTLKTEESTLKKDVLLVKKLLQGCITDRLAFFPLLK